MLRHEQGLPPSRLVAAGYLAPEHRAVSRRASPNGLRAAGLGDEFVYRGAVDRARKLQFFHDIDVLSVPSRITSPRACTCSRPWRAACRSCSRITARSPR